MLFSAAGIVAHPDWHVERCIRWLLKCVILLSVSAQCTLYSCRASLVTDATVGTSPLPSILIMLRLRIYGYPLCLSSLCLRPTMNPEAVTYARQESAEE